MGATFRDMRRYATASEKLRMRCPTRVQYQLPGVLSYEQPERGRDAD